MQLIVSGGFFFSREQGTPEQPPKPPVHGGLGGREHRNTEGKLFLLPITNYQLPITNYQLPITNYLISRPMQTNSQDSHLNSLRQWANLMAIIAAFGINVLANLAPFNGLTIGEISNTVFRDVKIIPANYAFAIWGLIYLGLFGFALYQFLPQNQENPRLEKLGFALVLASVAQIIWVFLFQYQMFFLSLGAMIAILNSLIVAYLRLNIGRVRVSKQERWYVDLPISIYLGWISVATIVNVALVLENWQWKGGGISPELWTAILLVIAGTVASILIIERNEIAYPFVIMWALCAIAVRQTTQPLILVTAIGVSLSLGLFGLSLTILRRRI
jgi:hypothetical protein